MSNNKKRTYKRITPENWLKRNNVIMQDEKNQETEIKNSEETHHSPPNIRREADLASHVIFIMTNLVLHMN